MRLLSTRKFTFHEFHENAVPEYAILSHTWDGDEVTLQNMLQSNARTILTSSNPPSKYWKKIQGACRKARQESYAYIWIDSCCIDKTNSAELQEAINSMFRWYRKSTVCLALLSDVDKSDFVSDGELQRRVPSSCRWFTRGWTLQELLAPDNLVFFDVNWKELGSRSGWANYISKATGILPKFLLGNELDPCKTWDLEAVLRDTSVATKMSWAASRQTTRVEDQAYCLLGLFDIHMPMLYGEGRKAFVRLQQEIMKSTDDCTLLAWGYNEPLLGAPVSEIPFLCRCCRFDHYSHLPSRAYPDIPTGPRGGVLVKGRLHRDLGGHNHGGRPRSLFATSPQDFRFAGDLKLCGIPEHKRPAFSTSQRGLEMSLPIVKDESHDHIVYGLLACTSLFAPIPTDLLAHDSRWAKIPTSLVAIPLIRSSIIDAASKDHEDEYVQSPFCLPCKVPVSFSDKAERMSICIRNEDCYRRLWDSAGYLEGQLERSLIFDFGHPLATKKGGSTLRLELMYPFQPLYSMYFTLLRDSCPYSSKSCAPSYMWPGGASLNNPHWWSYHLARPPFQSRTFTDTGPTWDEIIHKKIQNAPNSTIAAALLSFDPFPQSPKRSEQTRILLVVSSDLSCRVKNWGPSREFTLQTLMDFATQPELAGPKLERKRREVEDHKWWTEARIVYKLVDGMELCLRTWC
ncbi:HET-domain-containing protein [Neurospora crassa]|uniref:Heterokaryon incompatibility domain-containing protein n=1 Tax=Neurospora crassa (strain ATCC 24698 / 74-OR23-1A / CBS 708.71 / DSM 1257 / FGSC 987) TaxID=367110 RepID=A7UX67_NEUCR|nr:hypothetical protein NCU11383 [Neurospora crassa OR74A]EDO64980.2 hypothetical protein NCU11383 [Neurospora crassa OR74A]KHE80435.1 HET-domain-containing protein [Neurospora crassa]|eukprot:XP_001728071.2 hypothetical protein NCU11383 [Neurospora crassa OR74A]